MQLTFLKQFPLIRVLIPLIAGVWVAGHISLSGIWVFALVITAFVLWFFFSFRFLRKPSFRIRHLPGVFLLGFVFLFGLEWADLRKTKVVDSNTYAYIKGYVVDGLGQTSKSYKYKVVSEVLKTDSVTYSEKLTGILYVAAGKMCSRLKPGDVVFLKGRLIPFDMSVNPYAFNYSEYLIHERISFRIRAFPKNISLCENESVSSVAVFVNRLHDKISSVYEKAGITGDELGLLKAVFMGDRSGLMPESKKAFSDAGVMHLLAVSGLHLGIIYMLLVFLLKPLSGDKTRKLKVLMVLMILWSYALFTGLSSSVFRAAVMFSMMETGTLLRRSASVFNQLIASMLIIILIDPYSIYKAGFWLSHAAVAGIAGFYPFINRLLSFRFVLFRWVWSLVSVSLAAQLATFPLSIYYFHKFPVYFILSNVLMVPVLTPVLLLAFAISLMAVFPVSISFISLPAAPLNVLLKYMTELAGFIGGLPGADIKYVNFTGIELFLFGMLFFSLILYFDEKRKAAIFISLISMIVMISSFTIDKLNRFGYSSFVVFSQWHTTILNRLDHEANRLFLSDSLTSLQTDYVCGGYWSKHGAGYPEITVFRKEKPQIELFTVGDKKILLLHNIYKLAGVPVKPEVNSLILSGQRCAGLNELKRSVSFDDLIISTGLSSKMRYMIRGKAELLNIPYFDVNIEGAWRCETYGNSLHVQ